MNEYKFWIRFKTDNYGEIDRCFEDYPKMHHFIEKHSIRNEDIVFIKTKNINYKCKGD